jgi:galactoside O-acetyltransferase
MSLNSNSFYSRSELEMIGFQYLGLNINISRYARIYGAEYLSLANNVRIDDFCVISIQSSSSIGNYVHFGTSTSIHCPKGFDAKDFAGISSGSRVFGVSDDFTDGSLMHSMVPPEYRNISESRIILSRFSQIGANCVILPNSFLAEGTVLGANSMLKSSTQEWTVYAGVPAKEIGLRRKIFRYPQILE